MSNLVSIGRELVELRRKLDEVLSENAALHGRAAVLSAALGRACSHFSQPCHTGDGRSLKALARAADVETWRLLAAG